MSKQQIGVVGMAVMGRNLALNIESRGYTVSIFNRSREKTEEVVAENPGKKLVPYYTVKEFVESLAVHDYKEVEDAIGDQWVTVVIGMAQSAISYQEAIDNGLTWHTSPELFRVVGDESLLAPTIVAVGLISDGILKGDKQILSKGYGTYLNVLRLEQDVFEAAVEKAWNTIKDRKGKMVNGVFVKEQDLVQ